jgi:hypothetical protein
MLGRRPGLVPPGVVTGGAVTPRVVTEGDRPCVHGPARACARIATPASWTWTWTITHRHHHTHRQGGGEADQHSSASQRPATPHTSR